LSFTDILKGEKREKRKKFLGLLLFYRFFWVCFFVEGDCCNANDKQ
jgi:hypothetical protein